jgi:hypothetical protein
MRDALRLGCALAIGVAIAFPAGVMFAGRERAAGRPPVAASADRRQVFSPVVAHDPYFLDRQRANTEALERRCRDSGELCPEARQARAWLEGQLAGR